MADLRSGVALTTILLLVAGCAGPGDDPTALCRAGFDAFVDGDLDTAEIRFERALELEPGYVGAHYGMALTTEALGSPYRALEHLDRVIEGEPDFALAYHVRGMIHAEVGSEARAATDAATAARLDPSLEDGIRGQVSVLGGGGPALCVRR